MDQSYLLGPLFDAVNEVDQVVFIGMGGVATDGFDACAYIDAFIIQPYVSALGAVLLDIASWGALGLVADEEYRMPGVVQHRFQVVNDPPCIAHTAAGDNDGGAFAVVEVLDHLQVLLMVVDHKKVVKAQWFAAPAQMVVGFFIPVGFQFFVQFCEPGCQRGVQNNRQGLGPVSGDRF